MNKATLRRLNALKAEKQIVGLLTRIHDGAQEIVTPATSAKSLTANPEVQKEIKMRLLGENAGRLKTDPGLFLACHLPPLRLIIMGAVHIAQALAPMARIAGYETLVVDPRRAWATAERFPSVTVDHRWPDEALSALAPDRRTAVVALTHDPKIDDPGLTIALASEAFYIGALGSTRTHAKRLTRLGEAGLTKDQVARIRAPIGLDLGGRSPAEIATAILAEIIAARHGHLKKVGR